MKKFLFKFPSRGRPEKFKSTLQNHLNKLSNNHKYKFVFSFDNDDEKMNNDDIRNFIKSLRIDYEIYYGDNKNKIEAINANIGKKKFDILMLIADDMVPILENYDEIISNIIDESPNGLDTTIHFNTARWGSILDIWCVMGKKYYDRFKYIYHPDYKSIFCDNEYTEVAKILNRYKFSEYCPFEHVYISGDDTEIKNWQYNSEDWQIYEKRKKNKFGLDGSTIIDEKPSKFSNVIEVDYLGKKFNVLENDGIGIDIKNGKIWENHIYEFLKNNLKKTDTYIDVGSHYGCHSLIASEMCEKVYSFEPQKILFDIQVKNFKDNNIMNVKVFNNGLSNKNEILTMNKLDYEQSWINSGDVSVGLDGEEISLKKLDSYEFENVGIIKIDVQGYEKFVIEGALETIKKFKPILIVEFESGQLQKFGYGPKDLFDYIRSLDYVVYFLEYTWPSDHVFVHKDFLKTFKKNNKIEKLNESNDLNNNLENGVEYKIVTNIV
jgi:FkbM family methyltransferase